MDENKWNLRFMRIAREVASWSKDPGHKVGAVITSPNHHIISTGYNGVPKGIDEPEDEIRRVSITIHAEVNAVMHGLASGQELRGSSMYIYQLAPCASCASLIIQNGISKVFLLQKGDSASSWIKSQEVAAEFFKKAGVYCTVIGGLK